jgi:alpha-tubulin suppressor-like RCC1 family protein
VGTGDCDGQADNACETKLASTATHCGVCGHACAEGEACSLGACVRAPVLALSSTQGCVVASTGKLRCWGTFRSYKEPVRGDPSELESAVARPVAGADDVVAIRSAVDESCAVLRSGHLRCWAQTPQPRDEVFDDAVDVAVDVPCALQAGGTVTCVQPDDDDGNPAITPLAGLHDAVALTTSANFACALRKNDAVACWGRLKPLDRGGHGFTPTPLPGLVDIGHVASFGHRACAVRRTGQVACWGAETVDLEDEAHNVLPTPTNVAGVVDAVEVAVGGDHTCALRRSGEVACWGKNSQGQLGDGRRQSSASPVAVQGLNDAVHVAAGREVSCAMRRSGAVVCWGSALRGGLGNGITASAMTPVEVPGVSDVTQIAPGNGYTCALHGDGKVTCWGRGGASPEGDRVDSRAPWTVPGLDDATALVAGRYRVCAVRKSGEVACLRGGVPPWIDPAAPGNAPWKPSRVEGLGAVKALGSFEGVSVALRPNGSVDLVSIPAGSRPDDGPLVAQVRPVPGIRDAVAVAGSSREACVLRRGGSVACFGFAWREPLADTQAISTPLVEIKGVRDVERIFAADRAIFAVRKGGTLFRLEASFPNNPGAGFKPPQLAKPSPIVSRTGPTRPAVPAKKPPAKREPSVTLDPVADGAIAVARVHHDMRSSSVDCLLLASGQVRCHGDGGFGQLGHPASEADAPVTGLLDATAVAMGATHACALRKNGHVVCWGDDLDDELGGRAPAYATTPVPVQGLDQ